MRKATLLCALLAFGVSTGALAKTIHIKFNEGQTVEKHVHLNTNDVVMLDTTVQVGHPFWVEAEPEYMTQEENNNFMFEASVVGVQPERQGAFEDTIYAGANPGWVSYTFLGENATDAIFLIHQ